MNWNEITEAKDLKTKPAGSYHLSITKASNMKSKKGTPGLEVEFTIIAGEYKKSKFWRTFYLNENCLPFIKSFIMATEYAKETDPVPVNDGIIQVDSMHFQGIQLMGWNDPETYTDNEGNKKQKDKLTMFQSLKSASVEPVVVTEQASSSSFDEKIPF